MKRIVVFALVLNAALLGVIAHQLVAIAGGGAVATQNGDTNGDGARDITDAVYLLSWLFQGGAEPVAIAQEGGNDEEVAQLRAMVNNMFLDIEELRANSINEGQVLQILDDNGYVQAGDLVSALRQFPLREEFHPVAFSGNFEELENVPVAQGGESNCSQLPSNRYLRNADLSNMDFSGCDLSTAHLERANLSGTDLSGANLMLAVLWGTDLTGANLENANLFGASFQCQGDWVLPTNERRCQGRPWASLQNANLRGAILRGLSLGGTWGLGVNMVGADLTGADLSNAFLSGADLTGANLQDADLRGAQGPKNFLEGTVGTPAFMPDDPWE